MSTSDVVVVVPAHDEQELLPGCLAALSEAARQVDVPVQTIVVLDACTDATGDSLPSWVTPLVVDLQNVGGARAAGFASITPGPRTWFATTDADSRVPAHWLAHQLVSAAAYDVFVGTVRVTDWGPRDPAVAGAHDRAYADRDGHRHVHGANLGLRAVAYARLGGFCPLAVHEDADLVTRVEAAGLRVDWSGAAPVVTSARVSHRAPGGFSAALDGLTSTVMRG